MTVDPKERRVEAALKEAAMVQVAVWEVSSSFQWPRVGEFWTLYRESGFWHLGKRLEGSKEPDKEFRVEDMEPGHLKLGATEIFTDDGNQIVAYPPEATPTGSLLVKTDEGWAAQSPPLTGTTTPLADMTGITTEADVDGTQTVVEVLDGQVLLAWVNAQVNPGSDPGANEIDVYLNVGGQDQLVPLKAANFIASGGSSWEMNVSGAYRLTDLIGDQALKLTVAQTAGVSTDNALLQLGTQLLYMVLWE